MPRSSKVESPRPQANMYRYGGIHKTVYTVAEYQKAVSEGWKLYVASQDFFETGRRHGDLMGPLKT
jgi:hypothetical protein